MTFEVKFMSIIEIQLSKFNTMIKELHDSKRQFCTDIANQQRNIPIGKLSLEAIYWVVQC